MSLCWLKNPSLGHKRHGSFKSATRFDLYSEHPNFSSPNAPIPGKVSSNTENGRSSSSSNSNSNSNSSTYKAQQKPISRSFHPVIPKKFRNKRVKRISRCTSQSTRCTSQPLEPFRERMGLIQQQEDNYYMNNNGMDLDDEPLLHWENFHKARDQQRAPLVLR